MTARNMGRLVMPHRQAAILYLRSRPFLATVPTEAKVNRSLPPGCLLLANTF